MNAPHRKPLIALGEVAAIEMGQAPSGDTYNDIGDGLPLIAGASDFGSETPTPSRSTTAPAKRSKRGDILVCIRATIGDLNWSDREYCLGRGVAGLRANEDVLSSRYLWQVLEFSAPALAAKGRGATFKQVTRRDIAELPIPLPPLEEQRRIAAILDKADALRRLRRLALDRLNILGQAIFHEMFSAEIRTRPQRLLLGDCLAFLTSGGRGWAKYYRSTGSRFIRSLDVQMNAITHEDAAYVVPPNNAEAKRTKVARGDVLLTITGSKIGRVAPVDEDLSGSFVCQHVAIMRPKHDAIGPAFLSFFLSLQPGQEQIARK